jgi:hypothetical protein
MDPSDKAKVFVQVCREHGVALGTNAQPSWVRRLYRRNPREAYLWVVRESDEVSLRWFLWSLVDEERRGVA